MHDRYDNSSCDWHVHCIRLHRTTYSQMTEKGIKNSQDMEERGRVLLQL